MNQEKLTYYVDMTNATVLPEPIGSTSFVIHATRQEVQVLERVFEKNHEADTEAYVRAHIPTAEYFDDPANKKYDKWMIMIYAVIYALGDAEAKQHIREMGILSSDPAKNPTDIEHM